MWTTLCSRYALTDLPESHDLARQVIANWVFLEDKLEAALPGLSESQYARDTTEQLTARPLGARPSKRYASHFASVCARSACVGESIGALPRE